MGFFNVFLYKKYFLYNFLYGDTVNLCWLCKRSCSHFEKDNIFSVQNFYTSLRNSVQAFYQKSFPPVSTIQYGVLCGLSSSSGTG